MTYSLLTYPHAALRQEAIQVPNITQGIVDNLLQMLRLMLQEHGVGLSANQIGLPWNMFVALFGDWPSAFLNPVVVQQDGPLIKGEEACLSLPGIIRTVHRYSGITMDALDFDGEIHRYQLTGEAARIAQHEIDHLHGRLILDTGRLDNE